MSRNDAVQMRRKCGANLALASRTKLAVRDFKCAWFDGKHYFEFFPLHAVRERKAGKYWVELITLPSPA